ncbi:hypothetical protein I3843_07G028800 [Carya illinoinensis]|nr:hypothetical protein I3843_07G028800 [Carya illinoinensis]KAG7969382.1 hypothetical protein I3843_07G028800 [Carya illinoinensis]
MSFLACRKSFGIYINSIYNRRTSFLFSSGSPISHTTTETPSGPIRFSHSVSENHISPSRSPINRHGSHQIPLPSTPSVSEKPISTSGSPIFRREFSGFCSRAIPSSKNPCQFHQNPSILTPFQYFCTEAAVQHSTADGLTVEGIVTSNWPILDETESDWKSHAAAIAQSIHLIKKRLKWKKLVVRLDLLSMQLNKPDIWDDPVHAGKISREHGSLMGKMKAVRAFERELLEHIDMINLAREENDPEMESESLKALLRMRRNSKEKELQAMLSGEQDSCSCYIEVQAGAGGTESMDWAAMVMQMYKMWAQRRGYKVTVVDEMSASNNQGGW